MFLRIISTIKTALLLINILATNSAPVISWIYPTRGSLAGGTLIEIHGSGFPKDYFITDTRIFLIPDVVSRPPSTKWQTKNFAYCDIIPYKSTTSIIMCRTRAIEIDLQGVGSLKTPASSADHQATGGDPQAADGIMQIVTNKNNFNVDYQVIVVVGQMNEGNVVGTGKNAKISPLSSLSSSCPAKSFNTCYFTFSQEETPLIVDVTPETGASSKEFLGTMFAFKGLFKTWDVSNFVSISVGGSSVCQTKDANGNYYFYEYDYESYMSGVFIVKCIVNNLYGQVSGNIIPQIEIYPFGYAAVAAASVNYEGSGRSFISQLYPVIEQIDQKYISEFGHAYLSIRATGLIPLDTIDVKGTGQLTADTAADIRDGIIPTNASMPDGRSASIYSVDLKKWPNLFEAIVGGSTCTPVNFFWVVMDNGTSYQEIGCFVNEIGDYKTHLIRGSRGIKREIFTNAGLVKDGQDINKLLVGEVSAHVEYIPGGFNYGPNSWTNGDVAHRYTMFFESPLTTNYSFFLTKDQSDLSKKSTVELFLTKNGIRQHISTYFNELKELDNINFAWGKWSPSIFLDKKEIIFLELIEWVKPGILGTGRPNLIVSILDIPDSSTSAARGGPSNCTTCGTLWTWDGDRETSVQTQAQTLAFSSSPTTFSSSINFQLAQLKDQKYNVSLPTSSDWSNADGNQWNAGLENVRVSWGTSNGYFLINTKTSAADAKAMFYSEILRANCQWSYDSKRRFYDFDSFETINDHWDYSLGISQETQFCGLNSLKIPYGNEVNNKAEESITKENTNSTQPTFKYNTNIFPYMCMAFQVAEKAKFQTLFTVAGIGKVSLTVLGDPYLYTNVGSWATGNTFTYNPILKSFSSSFDPIRDDGSWQYRCVNVKKQLEFVYGVNSPGTINKYTGFFDAVGGYSIESVQFSGINAGGKDKFYYIDQFSISSSPTPMVQTSTFSKGITGTSVSSVEITRVQLGSNVVFYTLEIIPTACGDFVEIPRVSFDSNPQKSIGSKDIRVGNQGIYLTVESELITPNSPKISGSYILNFGDYPPVNISIGLSNIEIEARFYEVYTPTASTSPIKVSGSSTCYGFGYTLQFFGFAGNNPLLTAAFDKIEGGGDEHSFKIDEAARGGLVLSPIPADLLSIPIPTGYNKLVESGATFYEIPVSLSSNGITASCGSKGVLNNCLAKVVSSPSPLMPQVLSLAPYAIRGEMEIIVVGKNFLSWKPIYSENSAFSGFTQQLTNKFSFLLVSLYDDKNNISCVVSFSNDTTIKLTVKSPYTAGIPMKLNIQSPGFGSAIAASNAVSLKLFYILNISNVSPIIGSLIGGSTLTILGEGFHYISKNVLIRFKQGNTTFGVCDVLSTSFASIQCVTRLVDIKYDIFIPNTLTNLELNNLDDFGNVLATFELKNAFTFSGSLTGVVTSINPKTGSFLGNDSIIIKGTNLKPIFGDLSVAFGSSDCRIVSSSNTEILCITSPSIPRFFSTKTVSIITGITGNVILTENATFSYEFNAESLSTQYGSFAGGQQISIFGSGFCPRNRIDCHQVANFSVMLGEKECKLISSNYSAIIFQTAQSSSSRQVVNAYNIDGKYSFVPKELNITTGESVLFNWTDLDYSPGLPHVIQIIKPTNPSIDYQWIPDQQAFHSTNPNVTGSYEVKFNIPGSFDYMNGIRRFKGRINVFPIAKTKSKSKSEVTIIVNGISPNYSQQQKSVPDVSKDNINLIVKNANNTYLWCERTGNNVTVDRGLLNSPWQFYVNNLTLQLLNSSWHFYNNNFPSINQSLTANFTYNEINAFFGNNSFTDMAYGNNTFADNLLSNNTVTQALFDDGEFKCVLFTDSLGYYTNKTVQNDSMLPMNNSYDQRIKCISFNSTLQRNQSYTNGTKINGTDYFGFYEIQNETLNFPFGKDNCVAFLLPIQNTSFYSGNETFASSKKYYDYWNILNNLKPWWEEPPTSKFSYAFVSDITPYIKIVSRMDNDVFRIEAENLNIQSKIVAYFGEIECKDLYATDAFYCKLDAPLTFGSYSVVLSDSKNGKSFPFFYKEQIGVSGIDITTGSIGGGNIISLTGLSGKNFNINASSYSIKLGSNSCHVSSVSSTNLACKTSQMFDNGYQLNVKTDSNFMSYYETNSTDISNLQKDSGGILKIQSKPDFSKFSIGFWLIKERPDKTSLLGEFLVGSNSSDSQGFFFLLTLDDYLEYYVKIDIKSIGTAMEDSEGWITKYKCGLNTCGGLRLLKPLSAWSVIRIFVGTITKTYIYGGVSTNIQTLFVNSTLIFSSPSITLAILPTITTWNLFSTNKDMPQYDTYSGAIDNIALYKDVLSQPRINDNFEWMTKRFRFFFSITYSGDSFGEINPLPFTSSNLNSLRLRQFSNSSPWSFMYDEDRSPYINSIDPYEGTPGSTITLTGSNLSTNPKISFGDVPCEIISSTDAKAICKLKQGSLGYKSPTIEVPLLGNAVVLVNNQFLFTLSVISVSPNFATLSEATMVTIILSPGGPMIKSAIISTGGSLCDVQFANKTMIRCITAPLEGREESNVLEYISLDINGIKASFVGCPLTDCGFKFGSIVTPDLYSIDPISGIGGSNVKIIGSGFGIYTSAINITIGGVVCDVISTTNVAVVCKLGLSPAGLYSVILSVNGYGRAFDFNKIEFLYELRVISSPSVLSSSFGGGKDLVLMGSGFSAENTMVHICTSLCKLKDATSTALICKMPAYRDIDTVPQNDVDCPIYVSAIAYNVETMNGNVWNLTLPFTFKYSKEFSIVVSSISPNSGSTGGGTSLTVKGSGFTGLMTSTNVLIGGSFCNISYMDANLILCKTNPTDIGGKFSVIVHIDNIGSSYENSDSIFWFLDKWSSKFTWGGEDSPSFLQSVWIPKNKTVLLDISPPRLVLLLIEGNLIFDDSKNITLEATYIFIHNGGMLQIGSEKTPYLNNARIRLWGHIRTRPLPIYGSKVLAVRNGFLEMFGRPLNTTWTRLGLTAKAGDKSIQLTTYVDWSIGSKIVIASSSYDPHDAEEAKIVDIKQNKVGTMLTLDVSLKNTHSGVSEKIGEYVVRTQAEVGLLSRNIVVEGVLNNGENRPLADFYTDSFGGHIMVHPAHDSTIRPHARISYVELFNMGQAFMLGRYPIHLHMHPTVGEDSFIRGCSVYNTFNRAITAHGVTRLVIEDNIAYNVMGHTFFVEDGIEESNNFTRNLGILTRKSMSLLSTDQIPATFWITNPNNNYVDNIAAGSEGSGFLLNLDPHPTGPSFTSHICPDREKLGIFQRNSAHSSDFGFRIWIKYNPSESGCWGGPKVVVFNGVQTWANNKGIEISDGGAIQFEEVILTNNRVAQFAWISVTTGYWAGSQVGKGIIAAYTEKYVESMNLNTRKNYGILGPASPFFTINGTTFVNFDNYNGVLLKPCSFCKQFDGGLEIRVTGVSLINSTSRIVEFSHENEAWITDLDGSLTGIKGFIRPDSSILPPDICLLKIDAYSIGAYGGSWCDESLVIVRMGMNNVNPWGQFNGQSIVFTNKYGNVSVPWRSMRKTDANGYMALLVGDMDYTINFNPENPASVDPTFFLQTIYNLEPKSWTRFNIHLQQSIDHFENNNIKIESNETIISTNAAPGTWNYDKKTNITQYIISGGDTGGTKSIFWKSSNCPLSGCPIIDQIPTLIGDSLTVKERKYWSDSSIWEDGIVPNPTQDVFVESTTDLILDISTYVKNIYIWGTLRFDEQDITLSVENIIVFSGGKFLVGNATNPYAYNGKISVRGNRTCEVIYVSDRVVAGSKAIAVFGEMQLVGAPRSSIYWTQLSQAALAGSKSITLANPVDWRVGDLVVIGTTSYEATESENFRISLISEDKLTLQFDDALNFTHTAFISTVNGKVLDMRAEVALLTRNLVIEGAEDDSLSIKEQKFGVRIYVSSFSNYNASSIFFGDHLGAAIIDNVEIRYAGQKGFTNFDDYRGAVVFDYGDNGLNSHLQSSISNSAIHHCFHSGISAVAIGTPYPGFGPVSLHVKGNIVYGTLGSGYLFNAYDITVQNNLGILTQYLFDTMADKLADTFIGTFEVNGIGNTLTNNRAVGSESAGFVIVGDRCIEAAKISGNTAHSNNYGAVIFSHSNDQDGCTSIKGFYTYKNFVIGVFPYVYTAFEANDLIIADSRVGFIGASLGPLASQHQVANKYFELKNCLFIGSTKNEGCLKDETPPKRVPSFTFSKFSKSAITFSLFADLTFPIKLVDWLSGGDLGHVHSWPIINGRVDIIDTTFANFKVDTQCGETSFVFQNYFFEMDASKPQYLKGITNVNVDHNAKVHYLPPDPAWVTESLLVDMDGDGPKHSLIVDTDGSFFGTSPRKSSAVAFSELRFDPNLIPAIMRAEIDGNVRTVEDVAKNFGIFRDSCTFIDSWNAYSCLDTTYHMFVIESMDSDSQGRRISPIGLLAKSNDGNYLDLLNGPKSMGWCGHYACLKRLATFFGVVATDKTYQISFSGTNPQSLRLFILNANPSDKLKLVIDWPTSQRLSVYINGEIVNSTDHSVVHTPENSNEDYSPTFAMSSGSNYYDIANSQLTMLIKGNLPITVVTTPAVLLSMGLTFTNAASFFDTGSLVNNLAQFLGISPLQIRIVSIVAEDSTPKKKRGEEKTANFVFAISKVASNTIEQPTPPSKNIAAENPTESASKQLEKDIADFNDTSSAIAEMAVLATKVVEAVQLGLPVLASAQISSLAVSLPPAPPVPDVPSLLSDSDQAKSINTITMNLPVAGSSTGVAQSFQIPSKIAIKSEQSAVYVQTIPPLKFVVVDSKTAVVENLGIGSLKWYLDASLLYKPSDFTGVSTPQLMGTTNIALVNGTAIFADLTITSFNKEYSIEFTPYSGSQQVSGMGFTTASFLYLAEAELPNTNTQQTTTLNTNVNLGSLLGGIGAGVAILLVGAAFYTKKKRILAAEEAKKKLTEKRAFLDMEEVPDGDHQSRFQSGVNKDWMENNVYRNNSQIDLSSMALNKQAAPDHKTFYEVIETYVPDILFPDELNLEVGDIIHVTNKSSDHEWLVGHSLSKNHGGRFPARCVQPVEKNDPRLESLYKHTVGDHSRHLVPLDVSARIDGKKLPMLNPITHNREDLYSKNASRNVEEVYAPSSSFEENVIVHKNSNAAAKFPLDTVDVVMQVEEDEFDSNWSLGNEVVQVTPPRRPSAKQPKIVSPFAVPDYDDEDDN